MRNNDNRGGSRYAQRDWNEGNRFGQGQDSSYGANFGNEARPYGEDYGEDSDYARGGGNDYSTYRNRKQSNRYQDPIGFSYPQYGSRERGYGRSNQERFGSTSDLRHAPRQVFNRDFDQRHDQTNRAENYPGTYRSRGRGYMREDDYDRGTPLYSRSRFDERGERFAGREQHRDWWDRTRDEVASWFGDDDAEQRRNADRQHKGKGPRNYKRSDDRIREDINDRLTDDPQIDASDIEVSVSNGEVVMTGTVHDRLSKRRAEDLAEAVSGVIQVENRIRVGSATHA